VSTVTPLASGQITPSEAITVELVEADQTPAVVIVKWPTKASIIHPRRFPEVAATLASLASESHIALAHIKAGRKL
jgi:hypothetical protein